MNPFANSGQNLFQKPPGNSLIPQAIPPEMRQPEAYPKEAAKAMAYKAVESRPKMGGEEKGLTTTVLKFAELAKWKRGVWVG